MNDIECSTCGRFIFSDIECNFCSNYLNKRINQKMDIQMIYSLLCKDQYLLHLDTIETGCKGSFHTGYFYTRDIVTLRSNISKKIYNKFPKIQYDQRKLVHKFFERWKKIICEFMESNFPDEWSGYMDDSFIKTNIIPKEKERILKCRCGQPGYHPAPTPSCKICKVKWMKVQDTIHITDFVNPKIDIRREYRLKMYPLILTIMRSYIKKDGYFGILPNDIIIMILMHVTKFSKNRLYRIYNKLKNILIKENVSIFLNVKNEQIGKLGF